MCEACTVPCKAAASLLAAAAAASACFALASACSALASAADISCAVWLESPFDIPVVLLRSSSCLLNSSASLRDECHERGIMDTLLKSRGRPLYSFNTPCMSRNGTEQLRERDRCACTFSAGLSVALHLPALAHCRECALSVHLEVLRWRASWRHAWPASALAPQSQEATGQTHDREGSRQCLRTAKNQC